MCRWRIAQITSIGLVALLTGGAAAASRAKQCQQACTGLIAACTAATQDVGGLARPCKAAALKRCRKGGLTACAVPEPPKLPSPTCGNGKIDPGEQCDGAHLGGATCAKLGFTNGGTLTCTSSCDFDLSGCKSQAFPATGQTVCWDGSGTLVPCDGTGHDGDTQKGAALAYVDDGNGTMTDMNTGLVWEKQSQDGSVHDIMKKYSWDGAFSQHVATLNTPPCFAGHCDWRVPNVKELVSLVDYGAYAPAAAPVFFNCGASCTVLTCSCTGNGAYWSSTSNEFDGMTAWVVTFGTGDVSLDSLNNARSVRAVRGGR
jgi:hypothetical protein